MIDEVTVSVAAELVIPCAEAIICDVPALRPVARPSLLIAAMLVALLVHANVTPLMVLPLLSLAVAVNCCVPPVPMEAEEGETEIVAIVGVLMVVESFVDTELTMPPPDTLTWFT